MFAGILMMAGFVAMIMLNLSHAHSELDSLSGLVEMQSRELKAISQANGQLALELRSKLAVLDNLTLKSDQQKANQEQVLQQLLTLSKAQQKLGSEMEKLDPRIEDIKQKVVMEEQEVDGMGEDFVDVKEEVRLLKIQVDTINAAVERLAASAPELNAEMKQRLALAKGTESEEEPEEEPKDGDKNDKKEEPEPNEEPGSNKEEPSPSRSGSERRDGETTGLTTLADSAPKRKEGLKLPGSTVAKSQVLTDVATGSSDSEVSQVLWFKECGCTGIEIEAVTLLRGLVARLGTERVKTNKCDDTCRWPSDVHEVIQQISVDEDSLFPSPFREGSPHATVIVTHAAYLGVCGMNQQLELVLQGPAGRKGLVLISRSMVEVDKLEDGAAEFCSRFDSVWVPSAQSRQAFVQSGVSKDRIKVLPEAVDTSVFTCSEAASKPTSRAAFHAVKSLDEFLVHKPSQFTFLSMFKWEPRKNWDGLLESFLEAFPEKHTSVPGLHGDTMNISVRLLIKTQILGWSNDDPRQDVPDLLLRKRRSDTTLEDRLLIFPDFLNSSDIPKLFKAVDGFILPTHGEGWGLPLIEAMASGIPTISTGWGGQMDFMNDENSWPVSYDLVESPTMGARWAQPRKDALVKAMHEVVRGGHVVREKVERGCAEVHQKYQINVVANRAVELMIGLLEALHS